MQTISVVVPVYDGEQFLADALRSVLGQTRRPDEVIVVDDGSSDRSGEIARSFAGVRVLQQPNGGQASALNAGVAQSRGDFLAFLDADDRWLPDKLALQLGAFAEQPELELVYGHARQIAEHGAGSKLHGRVLPARLPSALLIRRAAWQKVGPFSSAWALGSVIEWSARARDLEVRTKMLEHVVYERRIHGHNSSLVHPTPAREYATMLKAVLDARRARSP
jgi:glycosyltransferase involved in cell wall biosynthesis